MPQHFTRPFYLGPERQFIFDANGHLAADFPGGSPRPRGWGQICRKPDADRVWQNWVTHFRIRVPNSISPEATVIALNREHDWTRRNDTIYMGHTAIGWFCPAAPEDAEAPSCSYDQGDYDQCDHCGQPEERK